jgi:DNA-binding NtrC family response regulator
MTTADSATDAEPQSAVPPRLVASSGHRPGFPPETLRSAAMRGAIERLERFAAFDRVTVVLEGETGTGKTYFARHLHACSARANRPLVHVDLGALDDALASSDLFGHMSGAYTGASRGRLGFFVTAHNGMLFLDEIGKASERVQCRLLSVIERRALRPLGADREVPVDVRLVVATNVPLERLAEEGKFLPDLIPRLGQFRVRIPPLRERRQDVPGLAAMCVARHAGDFGYVRAPSIDADLVRALQLAGWPGNLRQLDGTIQRLLAAATPDPVLTLDHCEDDLRYLVDLVRGAPAPLTPARVREAVRDVGSVSEAARQLGVARSTVQRQLRKDTTRSPLDPRRADADANARRPGDAPS